MKGFYAKREKRGFLPLHIERLVFTFLSFILQKKCQQNSGKIKKIKISM